MSRKDAMDANKPNDASAQSEQVRSNPLRLIILLVHENDIAKSIVNSAFRIHSELGPGLLESVYVAVLAFELRQLGYSVQRQVPIPIVYQDFVFEEGYRADLIVNGLVVVEVKSIEALAPVHFKQVLTYLRLADKRLGMLINFNEALIKDGIHRVVNKL